MTYHIVRQIGIDAGHRIPTHGSKCKNVHGHRYTIEAHCKSKTLIEEGEQTGMGVEFGFLKEEMMNEIDDLCDHGFIIWKDDPLLEMFAGQQEADRAKNRYDRGGDFLPLCLRESNVGKLYIVDFIPTAEHLARHWFWRLEPRVKWRSDGNATLHKIVVHETPNCSAEYIP